jgi:hypothetical protein
MSLPFQQAFEQLLQRAPAPIFPRARSLYCRKYALEPGPAPEQPGGFRTFLWEEAIEEEPGLLRVRARRFAVVHWCAPALPLEPYGAYLHERWSLEPADLALVPDEEWFREGGAFAGFSIPVVYERPLPLAPAASPQAAS